MKRVTRDMKGRKEKNEKEARKERKKRSKEEKVRKSAANENLYREKSLFKLWSSTLISILRYTVIYIYIYTKMLV